MPDSRVLLAILFVGLGADSPPEPRRKPADESASPKAGEKTAFPKRLEGAGIANLFQLAPGLYSGAQPEGGEGFDTLRRLGVKTIVSVDGAQPDAERARHLGMRYIHVPFGYDGIERTQVLRLVKTARDLPGPLFVHCHHGMHRGPAAAALCVRATENWDRGRARAWLELAGTDPKYKGLYASVDQFAVPSTRELATVKAADLPEHADVPSLVETMVQIDARWDRLTTIGKAGASVSSKRPIADPAHEAAILAELFREASRQAETQARGPDFARLMADADREAAALESAIHDAAAQTPSSPASQAAEAALTRMRQSCSRCHARFRDERGDR